MSGFRTPDYNEEGVGAGGRSAVSRHQYGDAADVYPDDRGRGRMDDLNRDGRVDLKDARILAHAAEMVEIAPRARRRNRNLSRDERARPLRPHRRPGHAGPLGRLTSRAPQGAFSRFSNA